MKITFVSIFNFQLVHAVIISADDFVSIGWCVSSNFWSSDELDDGSETVKNFAPNKDRQHRIRQNMAYIVLTNNVADIKVAKGCDKDEIFIATIPDFLLFFLD